MRKLDISAPYAILLLPLIGENVTSSLFGDFFSKTLSIASCLIILAISIKKKARINKFMILLLASIFLRCLITFFLKPDFMPIQNTNTIITPYSLIGYFMIILLIEATKEDRRKLFGSAFFVLTSLVVLNLLITGDGHLANNVATFKQALATGYTDGRYWLFGHRNAIFIHHLLWFSVTNTYCKIANINYKKYITFELFYTFLIGVISWNSTMLASTAIVAVLHVLSWMKIIKNNKAKLFTSSYLALEIGIVFLRIQDIFSFIIVDVLHRNLTFTGRTYAWNHYISQFKSNGLTHMLLGNFGVSDYPINTHNMFLGLLANTGLIGLALYLGMIFIYVSRTAKDRKNIEHGKNLSFIVFGFLINSLTMEFNAQLTLPLYLGFRSQEILKKEEKNESLASN